jgi:hypothetical protein
MRCRFLWLAITQPTWSPARHRHLPPAFRRAARTLLLVLHRSAAGEQQPCSSTPPASSAQPLGGRHLPVHIVEEILQLAAYPLSDWARAPWVAAADWLLALATEPPQA